MLLDSVPAITSRLRLFTRTDETTSGNWDSSRCLIRQERACRPGERLRRTHWTFAQAMIFARQRCRAVVPRDSSQRASPGWDHLATTTQSLQCALSGRIQWPPRDEIGRRAAIQAHAHCIFRETHTNAHLRLGRRKDAQRRTTTLSRVGGRYRLL